MIIFGLAVAIFVNSLWEDALLVLAVWALLRNVRVNASTRYFSWLVTLIAAVLLPIITTLPQMSAPRPLALPAVQTAGTPLKLAPVHRNVFETFTAHPPRAVVTHDQHAAATAAPIHLPSRLHFVMPVWLAQALFAVWAAFALLIALRLAWDLYRLERLKREALPLPFHVRDQMARWVEAAYGPSREVRICVSDRIEVPVAVGLFDSMILLPGHLLQQLSAGEIDRISLHELAHLRRADDWTNSLQRIAQIIFFFNPAIRFIGAQLDLEREVACDDWVLALTGEIRTYATCLTKMAELTAWPHRALAAPGVFATRKGISIRIERLLNKHRNARVNVAYLVPAGVVAALATLFVLANVVTPVIAYAPEGAIIKEPPTLAHQPRAPHLVLVRRAPVLAAQPAPAAIPRVTPPVRTVVHTIVHTKTVYISKVAAPSRHAGVVSARPVHPVASVSVPAIDVSVPAVHVSVPATHVDVPGVHVHVPSMHIGIPQVMAQAGSRTPRSCSGCDFSSQNLSGHDFRGQRISGSNFSHANLQNADFRSATITGVDFSDADLRGANFSNAILYGCNLSGANMLGTIFDGSHATGCEFTARSLQPPQARALLFGCRTGCDFSGADLRGQDLRGIRLSGIDLSGADLRRSDLENASFMSVDFSHAKMSGARVGSSQFRTCDFSNADLRGVDFSRAALSGTSLEDAIR